MRIGIVTPAPAGSRKGNRVTALRWAGMLRQLGHSVVLRDSFHDEPFDVLVALHARRSADSIERFHARHPSRPIVLAMTGTDLYDDLPHSPEAQRSIALATRIVLLQPRGIDALPADARARARPIVQSARRPDDAPAPSTDTFDVCVLGHLRAVKDPLRAAEASRLLPADSRVRIVQLGDAIEPAFAERARDEARTNPRFVWRGERPRRESLRTLAASRVMVLSSRLEGGANVVSEALACGVPVLSSRIAGSIGVLGEDYPGYFPVGDTEALAALLARCERDPAYYGTLRAWCERLRPEVDPARERRGWRALLLEITPAPGARYEVIGEGAAPETNETFARDVARGLASPPRHLDCRYLYDDEGSLLFEAICDLPEYDLLRAERETLRRCADAIAAHVPRDGRVVEFGSGTAVKTRIVLDAVLRRHGSARYVPVDISRSTLDESARALLAELPDLSITAIAGEYAEGMRYLAAHRAPSVVLWLGSNIGNFDRDGAASFLRNVAQHLAPDDRFVIGIDMRKPAAVLERAYDDAQGITSRFIKNLLARIDRELGGDFDLDAFDYRARFDETTGAVRMALVSRRAQRVIVERAGVDIALTAGEAIHMEDSYKYSPDEIAALATASNLRLEAQWFSATRGFTVNVFAPRA